MYEIDKAYEIHMPRSGKGTLSRVFKGQVIQITDRFITFRNSRHGFCESFLKCDLRHYGTREIS